MVHEISENIKRCPSVQDDVFKCLGSPTEQFITPKYSNYKEKQGCAAKTRASKKCVSQNYLNY